MTASNIANIRTKQQVVLTNQPINPNFTLLGSDAIPLLVRNLNNHYQVHKIQPNDPQRILSQTNPLRILTPYFSNTLFNSIFPSTYRFRK
jgi:hypothetical protein